MQEVIPYNAQFLARIEELNKEWYKFYKKISQEHTPKVDRAGNQIVKRRPDGWDYIVEQYMRDSLTKHFPGWSWEASAPLQFLGSEWVVAQGHLIIIDPYLLQMGINPPTRKFFGCDSVRIQYKRSGPHNNENIVDVGDSAKSANTAALKFAINKLCHIGDDIYKKRIMEEPNSNEAEPVIVVSNVEEAKQMFGEFLRAHGKRFSQAFDTLRVKGMADIKDFPQAIEQLKKEWGIGGVNRENK